MSKSVVFSQCGRIACAGQSSPEVILCLDSADLLADNTCERTTIEGVLTNVYKDNSPCNVPSWRYVISYDESLLADPTVALTSADVTGIFCKSCLTNWIEDEINCAAAQVSLVVEDTDSVDLTINEDIPQTLIADVRISADEGNTIEIREDGLYCAGGGGEVTNPYLNLVGLYHLNETSGTIIDYSGNSRDSGVANFLTYSQPGKYNTAIGFNAASLSRIQCAGYTNLNQGASPQSYQAWFNTTTDAIQCMTSYGHIIFADQAFALIQNVGGIGIVANGYLTVPSAPYLDGNWHHLVGTYDGTVARVYLDGVNVASLPRVINIASAGSYPLYIGEFIGSHFFTGLLDEVAVWSRALSSAEVLELYNRTTELA